MINNFQNLLPNSFAELLVTKFCHDITGPISAVHNGLEFVLTETTDLDDPASIEIRNQAIDLVQDSSIQSLARLQAYRMAYGVNRSNNDTKVDEVKEIMGNYFQKSNVEIIWDVAFPEKIPSSIRRIVVGSILLLSKVVIYGGKITVSFASVGNSATLNVRATATKIKEPKDLLHVFSSDYVEPNLDNVVMVFLKNIAERDKIKISAQFTDGETKSAEIKAEYELPEVTAA